MTPPFEKSIRVAGTSTSPSIALSTRLQPSIICARILANGFASVCLSTAVGLSDSKQLTVYVFTNMDITRCRWATGQIWTLKNCSLLLLRPTSWMLYETCSCWHVTVIQQVLVTPFFLFLSYISILDAPYIFLEKFRKRPLIILMSVADTLPTLSTLIVPSLVTINLTLDLFNSKNDIQMTCLSPQKYYSTTIQVVIRPPSTPMPCSLRQSTSTPLFAKAKLSLS